MSVLDRVKQLNRKWIIAFFMIGFVSLGTIYLLFQNINEGNRLRKKEAKEMQAQIEELSKAISSLDKKNRQLSRMKDSLQRHVSYMWPMRSIVYNAKLRDKVADGLDFKPGQSVRVKADSTIVIITDYIVGGNSYTYFIHFRTKNKKGEFVEYSPYELEALDQ